MDNLAKDAFMARQKGMTYGKYMATKKPAERKAPQPRRGGIKRYCELCGKAFVRYDNRPQKYCSKECKARVDADLSRDYYMRNKAKKDENEKG